jgi:hypothetical protein
MAILILCYPECDECGGTTYPVPARIPLDILLRGGDVPGLDGWRVEISDVEPGHAVFIGDLPLRPRRVTCPDCRGK